MCALVVALRSQAQSIEAQSGEHCRVFVEEYLSFHKSMTAAGHKDRSSVLLNALYVHPEDVKSIDNVNNLVSSYIEHEKEILDINEYYASCDVMKKYASIWFKITNSDPRFNRLYVVINRGKIQTLSKKLSSSSDEIDSGKMYVRLK